MVFTSPGGVVLRGAYTLTGKVQFELVYARGRSWAAKEIVIRVLPNGLDATRYGLVVSKKVGKAVVRNKIKRRLREILRQKKISPGWDIIVTARSAAANADFTSLGISVEGLLTKAGLFMGEHEGNSPGFD
jgi:ribonuclease P protein component